MREEKAFGLFLFLTWLVLSALIFKFGFSTLYEISGSKLLFGLSGALGLLGTAGVAGLTQGWAQPAK